jgi:hypothetical protein
MELSPQTQAVLSYFDQYTGSSIRKPNDLGILLEAALQLDAADEFNRLVFVGKCAWNVYNVLRKIQPSDDGHATVEHEFVTNINDLRGLLLFFSEKTEGQIQQRFREVYLATTPGTLRNVVDLAHDLARFKDMQGGQR